MGFEYAQTGTVKVVHRISKGDLRNFAHVGTHDCAIDKLREHRSGLLGCDGHSSHEGDGQQKYFLHVGIV